MTTATTSDETDPFATLEAAAKKQDAEANVLQRISEARTRLVLSKKADFAFYASLALRLSVEVSDDPTMDTMATDGRRLVCDPEFVARLTPDERVGVVAHEVAHCALNHMARLEARDQRVWNMAADLVVNPTLRDAGLKLPASGIFPATGKFADIPAGLSTEETYRKLMDRQQQQSPPQPQGGDGSGGGQPQPDDDGDPGKGEPEESNDPGGCGGVIQGKHPKSEAEQREMEGKWKVAVAQAVQQAKQRGELSAGLKRLVHEILEPIVDCWEVLREFVTRQAKNDYRFNPPNRRYLCQGLYLPSIRGEELGDVVLALDTSESISDKDLARFVAKVQGITEAFADCHLTILYHHVRVYKVQEWSPSDGPLKLEDTESGGTSHVPVFEKIRELGIDPTCLVCLTDMESCWPDTAPDYPVLFASIGQVTTPPFGQLVEVREQ